MCIPNGSAPFKLCGCLALNDCNPESLLWPNTCRNQAFTLRTPLAGVNE